MCNHFNSLLYTECEAWDTFPALSDLVLPFSRTSFFEARSGGVHREASHSVR